MRPVLFLLLIGAAARAQGDIARKLVAALNGQGDPKALCHEWEAPGWGPRQMKALARRPYTVGATRVNGSRAIVALADDAHLCIARVGDRWGCVGWRRDAAVAREWLYFKGKPAAIRAPEKAADAFVEAIDKDDLAAAEALCTHDGWTAPEWSLEKIFVNTRKAQAELRRIAMSQRNRRAHVLLHISQRGHPKGQFYLLVIRSREGWLLTAVTAELARAEEFLKNKPWPFRPTTPKKLVAEFARAFSIHAPWRLEKLCTGPYRFIEGGLAALPSGQPGEVQTTERRATCTYGDVILMLIKTPRGWRVDGHTADKPHAALFLKGEVPARR